MRLFRLVAPSSDGVRDEERLYQTSVQEVRQALYHALQLLQQTLELHTCILLMPTDDGGTAPTSQSSSRGATTSRMALFGLGAGVVGAAAAAHASRRISTRFGPDISGYLLLPRPRGGAVAFIAVPVLERGHLRAVLCADRKERAASSPRAKRSFFVESTSHVSARVRERTCVRRARERSKREQEILYRASQSLSTALTQDSP